MKGASHRRFRGFFFHEVRTSCVDLKFHDAMAQLSTTTYVYISSEEGREGCWGYKSKRITRVEHDSESITQ